jgi:hypothetical protein
MHRTTLILLDHIRSPLKLLREGFDYERRGLERSRRVDPDDPHAANRLRQMRVRAGEKPDEDHHWRWNGKGWYTRPDWNDGRCPPNSEPTDHNSCLPQKGHRDYHPDDHDQYIKTSNILKHPAAHRYSHRLHTGPGPDDFTYFVRGHNRPYHSRDLGSADSVDWGHEDGPQVSWGADIQLPQRRPLPSDPAHLSRIGSSGQALPDTDTNTKLRQHYVKQGFNADYVNRNLSRTPPSYWIH